MYDENELKQLLDLIEKTPKKKRYESSLMNLGSIWLKFLVV